MATPTQDAFETDVVVLSKADNPDDAGAGLYAGDGTPWDLLQEAPRGSVYFRSNGSMYQKTGPGQASGDWHENVNKGNETGGGGGSGGCLPVFQRDGSEVHVQTTNGFLEVTQRDGSVRQVALVPC